MGTSTGKVGPERGGSPGDQPVVVPAPAAPRDDRVLAVTRAVSAGIVPVLAAAFVILFLFPTHTKALWGWTIKAPMSAMFMGGGYLAGALFFFRAARARQWHRLGPGFVGTTTFATLLGLATFINWERFNHRHVSFWAWLALYVVTPLLLPWLWIRNRRHDPVVPESGDPLVPARLAVAVASVGAAQLAFALVLFVRPTIFIDRWPWAIDALGARSVAGFSAFPAVTYLAFAFERRWSALRWPFETAIVGLVLVGIAGLRAADGFKSGGLVWAWRIGLLGTLACLSAVWWSMEHRPAPD